MPKPSPTVATWAPNALIPGTHYRVVRPLGEGGMGQVYEVEHDELRTRHALKALGRQYSGRADLARRLLDEASALKRFGGHDHIVKVTDSGTTGDGRVYYVMERLYGHSLRDELRGRQSMPDGPRPDLVLWAFRVLLPVLAALDATHAHGVIHRDIKPDNIFLTNEGLVKLLDFGVAKCIGDDAEASGPEAAPNDFMGTPMYAAPECLRRQPFDGRADLYSLGVVLWELLAGMHPFTGLSGAPLVARATTQGVPPLSSNLLGLSLPESVHELVRRATALDAEQRFTTARAFADAILAAIEVIAPEAVPQILPPPRQKEPSLSAFLRGPGRGSHPSLSGAADPTAHLRTTPAPSSVSIELPPAADGDAAQGAPSSARVAALLSSKWGKKSPLLLALGAMLVMPIGGIAAFALLGGRGEASSRAVAPHEPAPSPPAAAPPEPPSAPPDTAAEPPSPAPPAESAGAPSTKRPAPSGPTPPKPKRPRRYPKIELLRAHDRRQHNPLGALARRRRASAP